MQYEIIKAINDYTVIALIVLVIVLLLALILVLAERQTYLKAKHSPKEVGFLVKSILALYNGNNQVFMEYLKKSAKNFPEEVTLFLLIGNMVRDKDPLKSLGVHRSLLFRKNISSEEKSEILKNLGFDYLRIDKNIKALAAFKQSYLTQKTPETLKLMVDTEIRLGYFEDAVLHWKERNKLLKNDKYEGVEYVLNIASDYYAAREEAEKLRIIGHSYQKYIKNDPFGLIILIYADILEKNYERAQKLSVDFVKKHPERELDLRYLLLSSEKNQMISSEIEGEWRDVFIALSNDSLKILPESFSFVPKDALLYCFFFSKFSDKSQHGKEMIEFLGRKERFFSCSKCGNSFHNFSLLCPECKSSISLELTKIL